jgi:hypothetical protein
MSKQCGCDSLSGGRPLGLGPEVIALSQGYAVVTKDGVCRGEMEKEVRQRVLDEVVRARHPFAFPARLAHDARGGAGEIFGGKSIEVLDDRANTSLQLFERLFGSG